MEHLYLPPSLRYFAPLRVEDGSPGAHACLEYDLVAEKRPKMVVDLGSGRAMAFSVFCQSMRDHDVDGLAYAIDAWEDEAPSDAGGETTFTAVNNFLHTNYRGFAYLSKQSPEGALFHFADGLIDLLRIDIRRLEGTVAGVLDAWSSKLAAGAIVSCAGVDERPGALEEWKRRMPRSLVFPGDGGLGVAVSGPSPGSDGALVSWMSTNDESERRQLIAFYDHARLHHTLRIEIHDQRGALYRKRS